MCDAVTRSSNLEPLRVLQPNPLRKPLQMFLYHEGVPSRTQVGVHQPVRKSLLLASIVVCHL